MVELVFLANLFLALFGLGLCLSHAWGHTERLVLLATTTVYGFILEQLVIIRFERYVYNVSDFLLTLGDVPLVIGFGWAAIIYSGFVLADSLGLQANVRPYFIGLFALHIDLAIDAIAIRVPFWSWTPPGIWFGVPLGNFMGWYLVATLFTGAWLGIRTRSEHPAVLSVGSLVLALLGLILTLEVWEIVATTVPAKIVVLGGVLLLSLGLVLRAETEPRSMDWRPATIPFLYHGSYLAYFIVLGMFATVPALLLVSLAMIGISWAIHRPLVRVSLTPPKTTAQ